LRTKAGRRKPPKPGSAASNEQGPASAPPPRRRRLLTPVRPGFWTYEPRPMAEGVCPMWSVKRNGGDDFFSEPPRTPGAALPSNRGREYPAPGRDAPHPHPPAGTCPACSLLPGDRTLFPFQFRTQDYLSNLRSPIMPFASFRKSNRPARAETVSRLASGLAAAALGLLTALAPAQAAGKP